MCFQTPIVFGYSVSEQAAIFFLFCHVSKTALSYSSYFSKSYVHIRNVFNIYKSVFMCTSTVSRGFKTPVTLYEESFKVASLQNM